MTYTKKGKVYAAKRAVLISICTVCTVIILYSGYMLYHNMVSEEAPTINGGSNALSDKTVTIARTKFKMNQGELLDVSKTEMVEVPFELAPQGAVTSLSMLENKRLKREIAEKEFLNAADLTTNVAAYGEGDRLIEHNFSEGAVPASVTEGSEIDIKLFIKGGEDCVVISKAMVISRSANLLSFYMDWKEQEYIKEAATEGLLFAVRYIDTSQKASEVTYTPLYDKGRK